MVDTWRADHLWTHTADGWKLKHAVWGEGLAGTTDVT